jgi:CheY-like chemotaxis protein
MALEMDPDHTHAGKLKTIQDCVESGARLARQLLGFARLGKYEIQSTDINALARETTDMFGRTRQELRIIQKYQENVWPVEADRVQIEQVLLNLFINAWQAMPDGGDLFLETANTTLDDRQASTHGVEPGKYVKITLADTGMGMDPATMERIFDPFFTTKAMGRGTGLGLASAYGIVSNHGGVIAVSSRKGDGTTFQVYLRASAKPSLGTAARIPPSTQVGCETILLVDDDPLILEVGQAMLNRLGYCVQVARGGQEALAAYRTQGDQIDLVILDMIMPDMGGGKTYDQLKAMRPDIKVLLSSGYSIDGQAATIMNRGCSGFIQKPFDLQTFSDKIRSILDG